MLDTPFHAAEETTGMINVHRRLRMHGGEDCGITLSRSELGGLKAEIAVNLQ